MKLPFPELTIRITAKQQMGNVWDSLLIRQIYEIIFKNQTLSVPIAGALLEFKQVGESRSIGCNPEAPGLPCTRRHPWNLNVEAMQVVWCAQLRSGHFHRHEVESGSRVQWQFRCQFDIAWNSQGLRISVVRNQLAVSVLVRLAVRERIVEIDRPWNVRIRII